MLTIEEINKETSSNKMISMVNNGIIANQATMVTQSMILQISAAQLLGENGITVMSAIGVAFILGMLAERDGWCLDESLEKG